MYFKGIKTHDLGVANVILYTAWLQECFPTQFLETHQYNFLTLSNQTHLNQTH